MDIQKEFGIKLRNFRKEVGLSQEKLALLADLDRTYIHSIEKGDRNVSIGVIQKLAKALEIEIVDFFIK